MRQRAGGERAVVSFARPPEQIVGVLQGGDPADLGAARRGARGVGTRVPWRDAGSVRPGLPVHRRGLRRRRTAKRIRARSFRTVSPGFFAALGVPIIAGRDFNDGDRRDAEPVVIISQSVAQRMFPSQEAVNRHVMWTDPVMKFIGISTEPRRIVGVGRDVDDENIVPGPAMTVYHPMEQEIGGGRLFVHTQLRPVRAGAADHAVIRELSADQPVERAATLEDVRAEVLAPNRLNTLVFGGFAARGADDRDRRRGRRAGVLGERADARVRHPAGDRIASRGTCWRACSREGAVIAAIGVIAGVRRRDRAARLVGS